MYERKKISNPALIFVLTVSLFLMSCLPSPPGGSGDSGGKTARTITVYGFSIMKELFEKEI